MISTEKDQTALEKKPIVAGNGMKNNTDKIKEETLKTLEKQTNIEAIHTFNIPNPEGEGVIETQCNTEELITHIENDTPTGKAFLHLIEAYHNL